MVQWCNVCDGKRPTRYKGQLVMPTRYGGQLVMPTRYEGQLVMPTRYKDAKKSSHWWCI